MGKIRVAFFADILEENFDGVSNTINHIVRRLPPTEFEPIFITPHPPKRKDFPFKVILCPYIQFPLHDEYRLALPWKLKINEILKAFKPDIIHWTSPSLLGLFAIRYGRKNGIPVSTIYHTHFPTYLNYYVRWLPNANKLLSPLMILFYRLYQMSDLILVPTSKTVDFLKMKKVEPKKLKIWGRGVDSDSFHPEWRDEDFKQSMKVAEKKIILFVSRLVKEKETGTLLKMYNLLSHRENDKVIVVVGDGPEKKGLVKRMPRAIFLGKLVGEELRRAFASADVFIFPSVTETFGNVILEAFASGLPVVAADAGGPSDVIQNEKTGFLFEPKNASDLLAKVDFVLSNDKLREKISREARKYAESQNWDALCNDFNRELKELASHRIKQ